jgi:hypothetical protein
VIEEMRHQIGDVKVIQRLAIARIVNTHTYMLETQYKKMEFSEPKHRIVCGNRATKKAPVEVSGP